jgi:aminobenzoyl-glutamate utilization protein A
MIKDIIKYSKENENKVVQWRRDFHKYAESGWTEFRTTSIIAKHLEDLGYEIHLGEKIIKKDARMGLPSDKELKKHFVRAKEQGAIEKYLPAMEGGFTGVVGVLNLGPGPVIGMRFDIDAVDMKESDNPDRRAVKEGYVSINDEAMHSCGHDGHAAIGMGVAEVIMKIKDKLSGTIKLIFQPAEEGVRGALSLVEAGVVDDVTHLFASHLGSGTPTGSLACGRGNFLATNKFDAFFKGVASHAGGSPQKGENALVAAANAVMNLYAITRNSDGPTRVNVGRMSAGSGRNVIAPNAHLAIETRGQTTELSEFMYEKAMRILEHSAKMHGCEVEIKAMGGAQSASSNQELAERVKIVAEKSKMFKLIDVSQGKGGGSEDYTYMMKRVQSNGGQATFMGLGADLGGWAHHTELFDIDEKALVQGVSMFSLMAYDILQ